MALNLSTLTSPATSADVLAEVLTTADFLEPVPVLRNLARGSQKGGDAKQDVALNQPKALPLIDGDGYLYLPSVGGNNASIPDEAALDITGDITVECDFIVPSLPLSSDRALVSKYNTSTNNRSYQLVLDPASNVGFVVSQDGTFNPNFLKSKNFSSVLSAGTRATVKATWRQSDGRTQFFIKESDGSFTQVSDDATIAATSIYNSNQPVEIGSTNNGASNTGDYLGVFGARIYASIDDTDKRLDVNFTSTNVRHGDTKFACATGQVVTINQSGNDPATVIKKSVLRFDGVNDCFQGIFGQTISEGHFFAAFSILGDGGEGAARIFSINSTGGNDSAGDGLIVSLSRSGTDNLSQYYNGSYIMVHEEMFSSERGDVLHEVKFTSGLQKSFVNNADERTASVTTNISAEEFNISASNSLTNNPAVDLEFLAIFASITDAQAADVVKYINNRNNVFSLIDSQGYYFFDPQALTDGDLNSTTKKLTGLWDGRIVGSDNGDTSFIASQGTGDDQPTSDKYTLNFADNTDHLGIPQVTLAAGDSYAWMVCGTSLGTFAYKLTVSSQTELSLLGHVGYTGYRKAGDLYGIILLPESATGKDIEDARKLLIDRGAADGTTAGSIRTDWYNRDDIVEFKHLNTSSVTASDYAWYSCQALEKFPALDLSNSTTLSNAWFGCTALSDFGAIQADSCTNFTAAWQGCSALTSFPADAKLGTSANNVNFTSAWKNCTSLTSFSSELPSASSLVNAWQYCSSLTDFRTTDLKNCSNFTSSWYSCSALTSFPADAKLGTEANNVSFNRAWYGCASLESLPAGLDLSQGNTFYLAFYGCSALTTVGNGVLLGTASSGVDFNQAFLSCVNLVTLPANLNLSKGDDFQKAFRYCSSLVTFPAGAFDTMGTPLSYCFENAWDGCSSLSAASVDNILNSIDTSGQSAPASGPEITIDYDGTTLSAATNTAVTSLKSKGWVIVVNNVTL